MGQSAAEGEKPTEQFGFWRPWLGTETEETALERSWPVPAPQGVSEAEIGSPGLVFTVTPQPLTTVSCLWRIYFGDKH